MQSKIESHNFIIFFLKIFFILSFSTPLDFFKNIFPNPAASTIIIQQSKVVVNPVFKKI